MTASWVVAIPALTGCAGMAMRSAVQVVVAIWSLKADARGRRHAIELLKVLQRDRHGTEGRLRASPPKLPRSVGTSSAIDSSDGD